MKATVIKWVSRILTVVIVIQMLFCVVLMLRGENASLFGFRFYYIVSPSMEPEIQVGDQIVVREVDTDELQTGDIITFASRDPSIAGYPNTHRIVRRTEDDRGREAFVTKGDNNLTEDEYLVYPSEIYGRVVAVAPAMKWFLTFYSFASTPVGFTVVVVMPLLLVVGILLRQFMQELGKIKSVKEEPLPENEELLLKVLTDYIRSHPEQSFSEQELAVLAVRLAQHTQEGGVKEHGKE